MPAKAKKITLYLENGTLNGLINISESDGWDFGGELYSCPRDRLEELLNDESVNKIGVYLLLSNKQVYVGQATDFKSRIKQHKLSKDWWERVVLLTSKKDELNRSHITYLESALIKKAIECGTSDIENKTKGNKHNLDKYDLKLLDQYLEEAYFILELIGINVFQKSKKVKTKLNTVLPPIDNKTISQLLLRAKKEVKEYLMEQGIVIPEIFSYAKLQEKKNLYWINPLVTLLEQDWIIVLNNQIDRIIHILKIPAKTFPCSLKHEKGVLWIRTDRNKYLDLSIDSIYFIDVNSKVSFGSFLENSIKY